MMKKQFVYVLLAVLFLSTTTACAQVTGSKVYITKSISVENFKSISVVGSPDVVYTQTKSGSPKIEIYGSDNLIPLLETVVENNTLTIKYKNNTSIRNGKMEIRVSAPAVESMKITGSGDIYIPNGYAAPSLKLSIQGSGDIKGDNIVCENLSLFVTGAGDIKLTDVKATNTDVSVTGSGDIELKGKSANANYSVTGSGDIKAAGLIADHVKANISGSGDIKCYAEKSLKGGVSGSGTVGYKGNPEISFSKKGLKKL